MSVTFYDQPPDEWDAWDACEAWDACDACDAWEACDGLTGACALRKRTVSPGARMTIDSAGVRMNFSLNLVTRLAGATCLCVVSREVVSRGAGGVCARHAPADSETTAAPTASADAVECRSLLRNASPSDLIHPGTRISNPLDWATVLPPMWVAACSRQA